MSMPRVALAPGITFEVIADEVIVYLPGSDHTTPGTAIELSGPTAHVFRQAVNDDHDLTGDSEHVVDLVGLGVLVTDTRPSVSRRTALTAGAVAMGAGVTILSLPQAAAASSVIVLQETETWSWDNGNDVVQFTVHLPELPTTDPSALAVAGLGDAEFQNVIGPVEGRSGRRRRWTLAQSSAPSRDTVFIGTFTWDGSAYRVTFNDGNEYDT